MKMDVTFVRPVNIPPEVLEEIFSYLTHPNDLSSVLRTCKDWRNALKLGKSVIFFQNIFPLIAKYLPPQSLLGCRLVCKQLKRTVDTLLDYSLHISKQEGFHRNWNHPPFVSPTTLQLVETSYMFYKPLSVDNPQLKRNAHNFMAKMRGSSGNPILGRSVLFQMADADGGALRHYDTIVALLIRFGEHVKNFTHYLPDSQNKVPPNCTPLVVQAFKSLPPMLSRLRNLQVLNITWKSVPIPINPAQMDAGRFRNEVVIGRDHCPDQGILNNTSFPPLDKLTTLNFNYDHGYADSLGVSLLTAYGLQLSTLICSGEFLASNEMQIYMSTAQLPNLKNLRVMRVTPSSLVKLSRFFLCLEQLQLYKSDGRLDGTDLVTLVLNTFSESLAKLEIDCDLGNYCFVDYDQDAKELGKLKHLSTRFGNVEGSWFSELIILKCKNIEILDIHECATLMFSTRGGNVTRQDDMVELLFRELPKLQKVRFFFELDQHSKRVVFCR